MSTLCCEVSLNDLDCEFPANLEDSDAPVRTHCWSCGQRACRGCSRVIRWPHAKRQVRICTDCNGDYWPEETSA